MTTYIDVCVRFDIIGTRPGVFVATSDKSGGRDGTVIPISKIVAVSTRRRADDTEGKVLTILLDAGHRIEFYAVASDMIGRARDQIQAAMIACYAK